VYVKNPPAASDFGRGGLRARALAYLFSHGNRTISRRGLEAARNSLAILLKIFLARLARRSKSEDMEKERRCFLLGTKCGMGTCVQRN
jgi:hypothetical protein